MAFLTDRKRVNGLGSAKSGTAQHWTMTITSVALLILTPFFLGIVGSALGSDYAEAIALLGRPVPAMVVAVYIVVAMHHLRYGMQIMIEDYTHGMNKKIAIIATTLICYGLAAGGLVALMQIAL
ncbi:succinate dehydrogenase, hydrophobic membrane anchor protein [Gymnodinialimonas ceratoperidinii]|uniref:Succinate dehydrogenase hydrophobic membrane anchor subunit n=1 Tax=Gymnodinialimonas ceratoperidinii TaxID=2856823 RepID=A0A8F6TYE1_9RHOB|nr:succinate dehydrogenase, hydrophobic membrane anchor protein [Gymnodinialimonas ceratoperidinii]QXT40459.1 succinate dehydrogenase, hydrophobic membrane anchor protein [Gymnodinialimonas ceratoperidinii]